MNEAGLPFEQTRRAQRRDGAATRALILDAAGRVFAERGHAEATSKEICALAGVNQAAVNYYFGGKESLYEAAFVEAHQRLISLETLKEVTALEAPPEEKLRMLLSNIVRTANGAPDFWGFKFIMKEILNPGPSTLRVMTAAIAPKLSQVRGLIADLTGFAPESASAQRALAFVILSCVSLVVISKPVRMQFLPATFDSDAQMLEDLTTYTLAGLRALGVKHG
jgi:AcrR family transcriptional regulator